MWQYGGRYCKNKDNYFIFAEKEIDMKFRTELTPKESPKKIDQHSRLLTLGSCFATEIDQRLRRIGVDTLLNPLGVIYNPISIAQTLERVVCGTPIEREELECRGNVWFSYDTHGSFDSYDPQRVVEATRAAIEEAHEHFKRSDVVVVTLGTAWVWELGGRVVANCHKVPAAEFTHRMLGLKECEEALRRIVSLAKGRRVIFTISPVRYLSEGIEANSLSKAILRVALASVMEECPEVDYFPAYEILMDDLRDYRYYAEDMLHPSRVAVEYVWERFVECYIGREAQAEGELFARLSDGLTHRPLHPESEEYRLFCHKMLQKALSLTSRLPNNTIATHLAREYSKKLE